MQLLVFAVFGLSLTIAPPASAQQDWQTTEKAGQLLRQGEYEQVIALLAPIHGASFSAASHFYDAHIRLKRRLDFIERVTPDADRGNPFVSYFLARALRDAFGPPRDIQRYLETAARSLDLGRLELGNLYFSGLEPSSLTATHPRVAADLQRSAQVFESCRSSEVVGVKCTIGLGHALLAARPSDPRAIALFEEAKAWGTLWGIYYFGVGVSKDLEKAESYSQLIKSGSSSSQDGCSRDIGDYADGVAREDPSALHNLAYTFSAWSGRPDCLAGPPVHYLGLLERAAKARSASAAYDLADIYFYGERGIRKDPVLAFYYYSVANMIGSPEQRQKANERLQRLEVSMSPEELSEARTMFRSWR